jgi:hypothetical protein
MKSVAGPLFIAVLLALAGAAFWIAGQTERRLAEVHQQLAMLRYTDAITGGDAVDASMQLARRLPRVGDALAADTRDGRATAEYWRSDYAAIDAKRDASGALTETDPHVLVLAANAEFRASQHATDRADALRRLDKAVKTYSDVLKTTASPDAAYNFEFAVRARDTLARSRQPLPTKSGLARLAQRAAADASSDLPTGPTLHGYPGAPPKGTDMSQFKIVIPKRGEERKDNPDAGKGGAKIRKG